MTKAKLSANAPYMLSILRITSGLLFLAHGTQRILSFPGGDRTGAGLVFDDPGAFAGLI